MICGEAGVDQNVGQIRKAVGGRQTVAAGRQRQPLAGAVVVELGRVEGAGVEDRAVGLARDIETVRDELVDVFEPGIVARVADDRLARLDRGEDHALVREAAERGALDRRRFRIEGVDLDDPAHGVGFVAIVLGGRGADARGIEADELVGPGSGQVPAIAAALRVARDAVARVLARQVGLLVALVGVGEVARPVLLRRQIGVPGGDAVRAVVQRAAAHGAVGAVFGDDVRRAAHRAADLDGRAAGHLAVARVLDDRPAAVGLLGGAVNGDAVRCNFHAHLVIVAHPIGVVDDVARADRLALVARLLGMQEARLDVFVIEADDAVLGGAVDREEVDAVVVLADLVLLLGTGVGTGAERRHVARDGLAHRTQDLKAVALGHDDGVLEADRHGLEAEECALRGRLRQRRLAGEGGAEQAGGDGGEAADEETPALHAAVDHLVEIGIVRSIAGRLVAVLVAHSLGVVRVVALEVVHAACSIDRVYCGSSGLLGRRLKAVRGASVRAATLIAATASRH